MRRHMRALLTLTATLGLVACSGGSGTTSATTGAATTTTPAPTTPAPTTAPTTTMPPTTLAPTTTTTRAPTTTTTTAAMLPDAAALALLGDLPGYAYRAADPQAIGPFAWMLSERDLDVFDRYVVGTVSSDAGTVASVLVMTRPASKAVQDPLTEYEFLDVLESSATTKLGGTAEGDFLTIEWIVRGTTPTLTWQAWFHEGAAFVVWSPQATDTDAVSLALATQQHVSAAFATVADMEGTALAARFVPLADCTYTATNRYVPSKDVLAWADRLRSDFPYIRHAAYRMVSCGGTAVAMILVAELPREFADHVDVEAFLASNDLPVTTTGDLQYVMDPQGRIQFVYEGCLYVISSESPTSPGADAIVAWATTIVTTPVPAS